MIPALTAPIETFIAALGMAVVAIIAGSIFERAAPAVPARTSIWTVNLWCHASASAVRALLGPAAAGLTAMVVKSLGGGWIVLPSQGPGLIVGVVEYLLLMDLGEYLFHRAQHQIPVLWAMHALHHSDVDFSVSTAIRHFWFENILKILSIYFVVNLIVRPSVGIIAIYGMITLYNYFTHMNVRVGFGRWSFLLNAPQYHRIHHSRRPQDHDRNFAALLPIYDVMFGAYYRPGPDEYPPTGLDDGLQAPALGDVLLWPLRKAPAARATRPA